MKSPSLEKLYIQLDKHILLAQSYSEIGELSFIIKACRLKPFDYLFKPRDSKLILHNWWCDEYGNSLQIIKQKKLKLTYNDLNLNRSKIVSTDLYYGLSIDKIAKISKIAYLCLGKDEDLLEDYCMISLLGIDNHLRTYIYMYGEWDQVSSLLVGIKNLKAMVNFIGSKQLLELSLKENIPIPCISGRAWLTCLPVSQDFSELVRKQCDITIPILQHN